MHKDLHNSKESAGKQQIHANLAGITQSSIGLIWLSQAILSSIPFAADAEFAPNLPLPHQNICKPRLLSTLESRTWFWQDLFKLKFLPRNNLILNIWAENHLFFNKHDQTILGSRKLGHQGPSCPAKEMASYVSAVMEQITHHQVVPSNLDLITHAIPDATPDHLVQSEHTHRLGLQRSPFCQSELILSSPFNNNCKFIPATMLRILRTNSETVNNEKKCFGRKKHRRVLTTQ